MRHYCTLFDHNYLIKGLSLVDSLQKWAGPFHLWLLCMSDEAFEILNEMNIDHVSLIRLEDFEDEELKEIKKTRTAVEYCWTLTPSLPTYVLNKNPEIQDISYIDADCFFFSSPEPVFEQMQEAGDDVLIIEHRYTPELKFLEKTSGRFNVGLVSFKNNENGRRVLEDWRLKCNEWCYYRNEDGKMGDQLYLDAWVRDFKGVHISAHLGACLAPWNIKNYKIERRQDQVMVNNDPLVFYHYHAFDFFEDGSMTPARNYEFAPVVLTEIYEPYRLSLIEMLRRTREIRPKFSCGVQTVNTGSKGPLKRFKRKFRKPYRWLKDTFLGALEVDKKECPLCEGEALFSQWLYDDRYGYPGQFAQYSCQSCQHKFLDVEFSDEELEKLYTEYYPRAQVDVSGVEALKYSGGFKSWLNGEKRAFSCVDENTRVLDIGCGYGETLMYHQNRGCEAFGVEADLNAQKSKDMHGVNIHVGIFGAGLFEENFFDFVTMDQVIEHLSKPEETLAEIWKILKPGGKLILTTPNAYGWGTKFFGQKWINWHAPYHLHHFSRKSLKALAQKSGYEIHHLETVTSSEWLYYQELHSLNFPEQGQASQFWAPYKVKTNAEKPSAEIYKKIIGKTHNYKINHLITRSFDGLCVGDNFLAELTCKK